MHQPLSLALVLYSRGLLAVQAPCSAAGSPSVEQLHVELDDSFWMLRASHTTAALRAVTIAPGGVLWASGARGTYLRSADRGATWTPDSVAGAAAFDFRGVAAVDARTTVLMVAAQGTARLYRTNDGGSHWAVVYDGVRPDVFLDAVAFWDRRRGIVVGDPVDGGFLVLLTADGGAHWTSSPPSGMPPALPGEAAFAASNSALVTGPGGVAWFATGGGPTARVFRTTDFGSIWTVVDTSIPAGRASAGIFALAFRDARRGVAVGGDYQAPGSVRPNVAVTEDGGSHWALADSARTSKFLSGVVDVGFSADSADNTIVGVGTQGTWLSHDGGVTWTRVSSDPLNAVTASGTVVIAVGPGGTIAAADLKR
jgi:photosystem II stability/assembly factor-like uncharacterized protein